MNKKRKITKEMLLSATGRKPSQPELQSLPGTPTRQELERIDARQASYQPVIQTLGTTPAVRFRHRNPQVQQISVEDLSKIEHRVLSASPAFAAPYGLAMDTPGGDAQPTLLDMIAHGQTDKDNADE